MGRRRSGPGHAAERDRGRALDAAAEADAAARGAWTAAAAELDDLARETAGRAGEDVGAIFEAQALFARDPGILDPALAAIAAGASAVEAIDRVAAEQADLLAGVDDAYFRERAADLRDVGRRVADLLTGRTRPDLHRRDGQTAILAADDLDPSLVAAIRPELVGGIALAGGAPSGHAAIVARALGIPLVLGLGAALTRDLDGCAALLDGDAGRLVVEPAEDDLRRRGHRLGRRGSARRSAVPGDCPPAARTGSGSSSRPMSARSREAELAARAGRRRHRPRPDRAAVPRPDRRARASPSSAPSIAGSPTRWAIGR